MAVGVVVGAAFGTIVSALVADLLTPLIAALVHVPDFSGLTFTVNGSVFKYGHLMNALISFLLVASAVFFFVKPVNLLMARAKRNEPAPEPTTKPCPECLSEIKLAATRCAHCGQPVA